MKSQQVSFTNVGQVLPRRELPLTSDRFHSLGRPPFSFPGCVGAIATVIPGKGDSRHAGFDLTGAAQAVCWRTPLVERLVGFRQADEKDDLVVFRGSEERISRGCLLVHS